MKAYLKNMKRHLTYANVMVSLIVFAMIIGPATIASAATSVKHKVTSFEIVDGTIKLQDLSFKTRQQLRGRSGAAGAKGDKGDTGVAGPAGQAGAPGPAGSPGMNGAIGASGNTGPAGANGINFAYTSAVNGCVADASRVPHALRTYTVTAAGDYVVYYSTYYKATGSMQAWVSVNNGAALAQTTTTVGAGAMQDGSDLSSTAVVQSLNVGDVVSFMIETDYADGNSQYCSSKMTLMQVNSSDFTVG